MALDMTATVPILMNVTSMKVHVTSMQHAKTLLVFTIVLVTKVLKAMELSASTSMSVIVK